MEMEWLVKEFLLDCQARNLSPRTISGYKMQLGYFLHYLSREHGVLTLEGMKPTHLRQYIVTLQRKGNKASYINDLIKPVKRICAYALQEGYTEDNPTKRVKNVKEPKVLIHTFAPSEIMGMIQFFHGNDYLDVRNRLILMILFDTGIRISELITLKPEQIKEGYFLIFGKGRKERMVPLGPEVSKWIMRYDVVREKYFFVRNAQPFYFLSKNGKQLTEEAVCKFMRKAAQEIGVNPRVRVSPHTCRHTFAQQQLRNGLDLYSLSRLLGHENVAITQRYLESIQDTEILQAARKTGVLAHL